MMHCDHDYVIDDVAKNNCGKQSDTAEIENNRDELKNCQADSRLFPKSLIKQSPHKCQQEEQSANNQPFDHTTGNEQYDHSANSNGPCQAPVPPNNQPVNHPTTKRSHHPANIDHTTRNHSSLHKPIQHTNQSSTNQSNNHPCHDGRNVCSSSAGQSANDYGCFKQPCNHCITTRKPCNHAIKSTSPGPTPLSRTLVTAAASISYHFNKAAASTTLTPSEFAQLLKTCNMTIKSVQPLADKSSASTCKRKFFSTARWRSGDTQPRSKSCRLKWHHTNFDDKPRKAPVKTALPHNATPLAQAWLDLATRDLATAETLRSMENDPVWDRVSRNNDPCLVSTAHCDDTELHLFELPSLQRDEPYCEDCNIQSHDFPDEPRSDLLLSSDCCVTGVSEFGLLRPNRKRRFEIRVRHDESSHACDQQSKKLRPSTDIPCDVVEAERSAADQRLCEQKMQANNNAYFHQPGLGEPQQQWSNNGDDVYSDSIFEDIFGESSRLFDDDSVNDVIMDNNFALFDVMFNNDVHTDNGKKHCPPASSYSFPSPCAEQHQGSSNFSSPIIHKTQFSAPAGFPTAEPFRCHSIDEQVSSDTDSGIHSPGVMKSPIDDVAHWKSDLEGQEFEAFLNYAATPCVASRQNVEQIDTSSTEPEPQLLNMDEQTYYSHEPIKTLFTRDSVTKSNVNGTSSEGGNHELIHISLTLDEGSSTSGKFETPCEKRAPSPSNSLYVNDVRKSCKRRTRCSKIKRLSEKGKSSVHLWEFIRDILLEAKHCPSLIKWEDRHSGVFRFVQSDTVAAMWGKKKHNPKMTYEKLSRAMRYYYNRGILERVDGRRLVYKFGPNATGWRVAPVVSKSIKVENARTQSCEEARVTMATPPSQSSPPYMSECNESYEVCADVPSISLPSANVLLGRTKYLASA